MQKALPQVIARPWIAWRVAWRLAAVAVVTLASYLAIHVGRGVLFARRRRADAWGNRVASWWARRVGRLLGMRATVVGRPPSAPFLLVANHLSYADIFLLLGTAGGVFVAKQEIASWPIAGHLCRLVGVVFIDRESKRDVRRVSGRLEEALAAGRGVIVFPEGTTSDGKGLLPFRTSLLAGAAAERLPVHWATLGYSTGDGQPDASDVVCWVGDAPLLPHLRRLVALPGFDARIAFGAEPLVDDDRKRLAARLRQAMAADLAGQR